MDRRFRNSGRALGRFIEECGEALAAAGKTVRYGWNSFNPLPGASKELNKNWLHREMVSLVLLDVCGMGLFRHVVQ